VIDIGATWWTWSLVGTSLIVAAVFAVRAVTGSPQRAVCGAHTLMGVAMAEMFRPAGDQVPVPAGVAVFTALGLWFGLDWLRSGSRRVDCASHVAIGSAAMVLMYLAHGGGVSGEHAGHGGGPAVAGGAGALLAAAGLTLTGYFLWHAWESVPDRGRPALVGAAVGSTAACEPTGSQLHRPAAGPSLAARVEPAAHVTMSLLMAVMFLGTV